MHDKVEDLKSEIQGKNKHLVDMTKAAELTHETVGGLKSEIQGKDEQFVDMH